jgi:hypothetical protein
MTGPLPALAWDAEELAYVVEPWAHDRDEARVEAEPWPFRWAPPVTAVTFGPYRTLPHPLDSPGPELPPLMRAQRVRAAQRAARAARRREQANAEQRRSYDVQVGIYAQAAGRGLRPDLILVDETGEEPAVLDVVGSVAEMGTAFHRMLEAFESGEAPAGSAAWRRRNGGV